MRLADQIIALATIWCAATGRSRARLSTIVADSGKFFDQIERPGGTCTIATFEKFLAYFRDPANWPDGMIPGEALALLDNFSAISSGAGRDPGAGSAAGGGPHPLPLAADETQGRAA